MDRFDDDDRRENLKLPVVKFNDGREFTHEFVFDSFFKSKSLDTEMKKALYLIAVQTPIKVGVLPDNDDREIDIEKLFCTAKVENRDKYQEVKINVNGVIYDANSTDLYQALETNGMKFYLNSR